MEKELILVYSSRGRRRRDRSRQLRHETEISHLQSHIHVRGNELQVEESVKLSKPTSSSILALAMFSLLKVP